MHLCFTICHTVLMLFFIYRNVYSQHVAKMHK